MRYIKKFVFESKSDLVLDIEETISQLQEIIVSQLEEEYNLEIIIQSQSPNTAVGIIYRYMWFDTTLSLQKASGGFPEEISYGDSFDSAIRSLEKSKRKYKIMIGISINYNTDKETLKMLDHRIQNEFHFSPTDITLLNRTYTPMYFFFKNLLVYNI